MPIRSSRLLSVLLIGALALGLVGCDSDGGGGSEQQNAATVQFASGSVGAVPTDSTVTATVVLNNPQGSSVSVEVLFAEQASSATRAEIGGYEMRRVQFDADAEDGATKTITFEISEADITGGAIAAAFALQQVESDAPARIGETREFVINLGPITLAEARERGTGATVTVEGTVTRAFDSFTRIQDESGAGLVIRRTEGDFNAAVADGTIQPGTELRLTGTLSAFNGLLQINEGDLSDYTVLGQGDVPKPQDVTLSEIASDGESYESELVRVEGLTFPDASGSFSNGTSYIVEGPEGNTLTFRVQNSDESALGGVAIPDTAFTYTGVVGEFSGEYQLIPVRPSDIGGSSGGGGGGGGEVIPVADARGLDNGTEATVEATVTRIEGGDTVFLQDESGAIAIFSEDLAGDAGPGDRVQVSGTRDSFSGLAQLSDATYTILEADAGRPDPQPVSLADVIADPEAYESLLLQIDGLSFEESGTFESGTNYTVTGEDGGSLALRIPSGSFYAGEDIPGGAAVTFTGVLGQFTNFGDLPDDEGYQLLALDEGDLTEGGGGGGEAQTLLDEDFQDGTLDPFTQVSVASDAVWDTSAAGDPPSAPYASINGFGADEASDDWLISPALNFADASDEKLAFTTAKGFDGPDLNVKISTNYDGDGSPEDADWTDITDRATLSSGDFDFVSSGEVDLSDDAFQNETVYIAFQYVSDGTGSGQAATWEVDDVVVAEESATDGDGLPAPPDRPE